MLSDVAAQTGMTSLPNVTGDGRDGFPSRSQHNWCVAQYLGEMCEKKRGKALIDKSLYDRILAVCFDDSNKKTETAQFRWWVRRTFKLYSEAHGHYLMHENRPIAIKEQIYDILVFAHAECGHGGRDKTSAAVRRHFSWIPKDVVSRFVSVCPGCHARTQKDDEYFGNKGADGYYPVNLKVRQMSIDSKQSTAEDYQHTASYQPSLAPGMTRILKAIESCKISPPTFTEPTHTTPAVVEPTSGSPPLNLQDSANSSHIQARSLSLPLVGFNPNTSPEKTTELFLPPLPAPQRSNSDFTPQRLSDKRKAKFANYPHIAKPPRPSMGRKMSFKTKEYKKASLASTYIQPTDLYCPVSYYGSQSSVQTLSNSEDDGASKFSLSSPPTDQSFLPNQESMKHYSLSQPINLCNNHFPVTDMHSSIGPMGEQAFECLPPDFSNLNNSHLPTIYNDPFLRNSYVGRLPISEGWNTGTGIMGDYMLPELLNSQGFDNSPVDYSTISSLQTPIDYTEPLRNEEPQAGYPVLSSWPTIGDASNHYNFSNNNSYYSGIHLPTTSESNLDLIPNSTGSQSAPSSGDTNPQLYILPSHEYLKTFANSDLLSGSSFATNSLGLHLCDDFQLDNHAVFRS